MVKDYRSISSNSGLQQQASAAFGEERGPRSVSARPQGFMDYLKNLFIDPETGKGSFLKIGAMLLAGGLGGMLTSGMGYGMIATVVVGAVAAFGAASLAPSLVNIFTGEKRGVDGSVRVSGTTSLTPLQGFQQEQTVEVGLPNAPDSQTTLTMPTVAPNINPHPEISMQSLHALQESAQNPDLTMAQRRTAAKDFSKEQFKLDTWVTTLASLDQPFRRYNSEERVRVMTHFQNQFQLTPEQAKQFIPEAPEVPQLRGNGDKAMEALPPNLEAFGRDLSGMKMFGQRWEDLSNEQKALATEAWDNVSSENGTTVKRSVIEKYAILNNWVNEQEYQFGAARLAAVGILKEKHKDDWFKDDYTTAKEIPLEALLCEDERTLRESLGVDGLLGGSTSYGHIHTSLKKAFEEENYERVSNILRYQEGRAYIAEELRKAPEERVFQQYVNDPSVQSISYADALIRYGEAQGIKEQLEEFRNSHLVPYHSAMENFQNELLPAYEQSREQFSRRMQVLKDQRMLIVSEENGLAHIKVATEVGTQNGFIDAQVQIVGDNVLRVSLDGGQRWEEFTSTKSLSGSMEDHASFIRESINAARLNRPDLLTLHGMELDEHALAEVQSLRGNLHLPATENSESTRETTQMLSSKPIERSNTGNALPA